MMVAELGSGSGKKTRWLLKALARRQHTAYCPIEISPTALAMCKRELGDIDAISIVGFEREYLDGLAEVAARRKLNQHLLDLSGKHHQQFTAGRCAVSEGYSGRSAPWGSLLLGTDLFIIPQLLEAYADPLGVTAAFNKNLLARINHELGADFELEQFHHLARFNAKARSGNASDVKTRSNSDHSRCGFSVHLPKARPSGLSSHKYSKDEICGIAATGFNVRPSGWTRIFSPSLLVAQ
jgi:uncharacterized SAM-dependent methyltransferase